MGQKVNPLGFRLGVSQEHASHWFAKSNQYSQLVVEDHLLRQAIHENCKNAGIASIHIERQVDDIQIDVSAARPRQLLGSFNKDRNSYMGIQDLRDQLSQILTSYRINSPLGLQLSNISKKPDQSLEHNSRSNVASHPNSPNENESRSNKSSLMDALRPANISIYLTKVPEPDASAACLAEFIVEELEKRVPFRRALKQAVQRAERASVKGIKVQVSGRLNGAEIARSERIHKGQVPLHTLRAKMQYSSRTARTIYGLLGVKV